MSNEEQKVKKEMENQNQNIVNQAQQKFNNGHWDGAIELFNQSREICVQKGWSDGVKYAEEMISKAKEKAKKEKENLAKKKAAEQAKKKKEMLAKKKGEEKGKKDKEMLAKINLE